MKSIIQKLSVLGFSLGLVASAGAQSITGTLNFLSSYTAASGDLTTANNVLTILSAIPNQTTVQGGAGSPTGSFSGFVAPGATVTMLNSFTTNVAGNGVTPSGATIWSVGGFSFNVLAGGVTEAPGNTSTSITLNANGNITGNGFTSTPGFWTATFQNAVGGGVNVSSTFSSSAGSVPDGGSTAVLLGLSLLGVVWFAKRKA